MRFKVKSLDYHSWKKRFAWFPVRIDDQWVWLETVEYGCTAQNSACCDGCILGYRLPPTSHAK